MRSNLTTNIVVTLVLSLEEAEWLHGAMQNPLGGQDSSETLRDARMRQQFFEATRATSAHPTAQL